MDFVSAKFKNDINIGDSFTLDERIRKKHILRIAHGVLINLIF